MSKNTVEPVQWIKWPWNWDNLGSIGTNTLRGSWLDTGGCNQEQGRQSHNGDTHKVWKWREHMNKELNKKKQDRDRDEPRKDTARLLGPNHVAVAGVCVRWSAYCPSSGWLTACSSLSFFQVAVTGAPPGQDPWGVIEDAHSPGASALLSHVGEKHLWWPALLQNR